MITMKGRVVSFTGKDLKQLQEVAKSMSVTPQEAFEKAIMEHMERLDVPTKKVKHECDNSFADEMYHLSGSKKKTTKRSSK